MTARIRSHESRFKDGEKIQLFKGPLLKLLTHQHCRALEEGERIWLPTPESGIFIAATVTKVTRKNTDTEISYTAGNRYGHFTIYPKKIRPSNCYRFLDEETLAPHEMETRPQLRVVGGS